jgi:hypothetical protein
LFSNIFESKTLSLNPYHQKSIKNLYMLLLIQYHQSHWDNE